MHDGFPGFQPAVDGCAISPRLPGDWTSLTITRIHLHEHVLDVSVSPPTIEVKDHTPDRSTLQITIPAGWSLKRS